MKDNNLDIFRNMLHNAIDNNNELNTGEVLKISQKLDEIIVKEYEEQLDITQK